MDKRAIGNTGEAIAASYLKKKHYRILARNWWKPFGEIDIIAEKKGIIYFVEVKSTENTAYSRPADKVNARKRGQIAKAAMAWFTENGGEKESGFLVAEVDLKTEQVTLTEDILLG